MCFFTLFFYQVMILDDHLKKKLIYNFIFHIFFFWVLSCNFLYLTTVFLFLILLFPLSYNSLTYTKVKFSEQGGKRFKEKERCELMVKGKMLLLCSCRYYIYIYSTLLSSFSLLKKSPSLPQLR